MNYPQQGSSEQSIRPTSQSGGQKSVSHTDYQSSVHRTDNQASSQRTDNGGFRQSASYVSPRQGKPMQTNTAARTASMSAAKSATAKSAANSAAKSATAKSAVKSAPQAAASKTAYRQQNGTASPYIQKIEHEVSPVFIVIESILLLAALAATVFFFSFLRVDFHYDYVHAAMPVIAETDTTLTACLSVAEPTDSEIQVQPPVVYTIDDLTLYDWTKPVPESKAYPLDWFEDTVFIGDSRTAGLLMYTNLKAINFSATNLTVATMMSKNYLRIRDENDEFINLNALDALKYYDGQYKAIYISLGLNELGGSINTIVTKYKEAIAAIREITAVPLYIQLVMPVTVTFAENSQYGITNERAYELNEKLTALAESERFFLLDPLPLVVLEDGTLDPAKSFDGAHLTPKSYQTLVEFLQCHIVEYSDYIEKK